MLIGTLVSQFRYSRYSRHNRETENRRYFGSSRTSPLSSPTSRFIDSRPQILQKAFVKFVVRARSAAPVSHRIDRRHDTGLDAVGRQPRRWRHVGAASSRGFRCDDDDEYYGNDGNRQDPSNREIPQTSAVGPVWRYECVKTWRSGSTPGTQRGGPVFLHLPLGEIRRPAESSARRFQASAAARIRVLGKTCALHSACGWHPRGRSRMWVRQGGVCAARPRRQLAPIKNGPGRLPVSVGGRIWHVEGALW